MSEENRSPNYSVLTYIIGDYEVVHEIREKDPNAEYILVTDNPRITSKTWTVVFDEGLEGLSTFDKCYRIRFGFWRYCHSDIVVRIDASIGVLRSLKPIVDAFTEGEYEIGLMLHPLRRTLPEEYRIWVQRRSYPETQARKCLQYMESKGYDFTYRGLFQMGLSIHRLNDINKQICERTLSVLQELGTEGVCERIDQTVFSYVMNSQWSHLRVMPLSERILRSAYLQLYFHGSEQISVGNVPVDSDDGGELYLFNRKTPCLTFFVSEPEDIVAREEELLGLLHADQNTVRRLTFERDQARTDAERLRGELEGIRSSLTYRLALGARAIFRGLVPRALAVCCAVAW